MTPNQFHQWRKSLDLTQAQAADQLGVSTRSVSTYETTGPIPKVIELACSAIYNKAQEPNFANLLRNQYSKLGEHLLVLSFVAELEAGYSNVLEIRLSSDIDEWMSENELSAKLQMCTVITPDLNRRKVAVVVFESFAEMMHFKLRWN